MQHLDLPAVFVGLTISLNGVDRTAQTQFKSVAVVNSIVTSADTADLDISISTTAGWRPLAGNQVVIATSASTEFGGILTEVQETLVAPNRLRYHCSCRDYTALLDRTLVKTTYGSSGTNWLGSAIVSDIIASYTSGFTTNNVKTSPAVAAQMFDYVPVSHALRTLADLLSWGYYVDYAKDIHFYDITTLAAPVASINLDTDITNYGDMVLTENILHEKNFIYVKDIKVKTQGTYSQTYGGSSVGTGTQKFFPFGYEFASTNATDISLTRSGVAQNINVDGRDGQVDNPVGSANDAFICFDNYGFRYDVPPGSTDSLVMTTKVMQPTISAVQDLTAQSTMATRFGTGGVVEFAVSDPSLTSPDGTDQLAQAKGNQVLARYAYPRLQGKFVSYTQGWRAGQSLTISSALRMGGFSKTFYVQQVRKSLINHPSGGMPLIRYDVELADSALPL